MLSTFFVCVGTFYRIVNFHTLRNFDLLRLFIHEFTPFFFGRKYSSATTLCLRNTSTIRLVWSLSLAMEVGPRATRFSFNKNRVHTNVKLRFAGNVETILRASQLQLGEKFVWKSGFFFVFKPNSKKLQYHSLNWLALISSVILSDVNYCYTQYQFLYSK